MTDLLDRREARIQRMFDGIAPKYDLLNHLLSLNVDKAWRKRVTRLVPVTDGPILDVCTGTGDLAFALAKKVQGRANVVGADFCRPMLERGAEDAADAGVAAFVEADARRLPVRTASVDGACVAFGLRNVVPPAAGLAELARVVKPGGRVVVLEFSEPKGRLVRALHGFYTGRVLPAACDLLSGSKGTYRYLPETIGTWMEPERLGREMEAAGLRQVRWRPLTFGSVMVHSGVRDAG
jgi:demethylmenaquinone methyltransferase/2-methoxy-6-polyprenyl-1,4-benzoquinol methylase